MSIKKLLVTAFVFFGASVLMFAAASSLGWFGIEIAGVGSVGQSALSIVAAVLCVVGSVCLGVGSVRLDMRIRASKTKPVALAQHRA